MIVFSITIMCLALLPPIVVFAVKPTAPGYIRSARLVLLPVMIFILLCLMSFMAEVNSEDGGQTAWPIRLVFAFIGVLQYTAYVGWFEYIWRRHHKQIAWPLKENLKYGWVSNGVLVLSFLMTMVFIVVSIIRIIE